MSTPETITFFGDNGDCTVDTVDFKSPPYYTKSKPYALTKHVKNIPLIRGYTVIVDIFINIIKMIFKRKLWLFLIGIFLFSFFFKPQVIVEVKEIKPSPLSSLIPSSFWDYWLTIALYSFVLIYVFLATRNHAAEHKAISAYDINQDLSIKNINNQPKENRRCGTVLVVWFLLLSLPLFLFSFSRGIETFLQFTAFSFAYELFILARRNDKIGAFFYSLGWLGQKFTTREPDVKLLMRSRQGLMKLLDEEGCRYRR